MDRKQQKREFYEEMIQRVLWYVPVSEELPYSCYAELGLTKSDIDAMSRIVLYRICEGFLDAELEKNFTVLDALQEVGIKYAVGDFWGSLHGLSYNFDSKWYVSYKGYAKDLHEIAQGLGPCKISCVDNHIYVKFE